jgi:hypothetical protein
MSYAVSGRLVAGALGALIVLGVTAVGAFELGRRNGSGGGMDVARREVAARVRADVEAASALRIGDSRRAALILELSIDDGARRLADDAALAADREAWLSMAASGAVHAYRRAVPSPDPQAASEVRALSAPEVSPFSPSLAALITRGREAAGEPHPLVDGRSVDVQEGGAELSVHYTTLRSILDCAGQSGEMTRVWKTTIQPRLREGAVRSVVLFPEDVFGLSASFSFTRSGATWTALAPCAIRITS